MTRAEEDYIKAIFKIAEREKSMVHTNSIASALNTSAASVTDMLKKLKNKGLVTYKRYKGTNLTQEGNKVATLLIRKHRLWEYFLVHKLKFTWDQVHNIAEELEHIQSEDLINRLDNYLGNPRFDPHGDPIPNAEGKFTIRSQYSLSDLYAGEKGIVLGVKDHDDEFLRYLSGEKIKLGSELQIIQVLPFDRSMDITVDGNSPVRLSQGIAGSILVRRK
ncbi:MAG TPA: metal-dependent transcriptional regulator [Saprospiraceae bacterium]|nr:metal-dependent transcriptional regulator [Saprospiraceae bacterium]